MHAPQTRCNVPMAHGSAAPDRIVNSLVPDQAPNQTREGVRVDLAHPHEVTKYMQTAKLPTMPIGARRPAHPCIAARATRRAETVSGRSTSPAYSTFTITFALFGSPPSVVQSSVKAVAFTSGGVRTTPFTSSVSSFSSVKSGRSGLFIVHELMPVVIQPMIVEAPRAMIRGLAVSTIVAGLIPTVHDFA